MTQYIYNKKVSEVKETLGNTMIMSLVLMIFTLCMQLTANLEPVLNGDWYSICLAKGLVHDYTIKDKIQVMVNMVYVIIGIIYVFFFVIFIIKQKLDVVKERDKLSVFFVIGYTRVRMSIIWYAGKVVELIAGALIGGLSACGIWMLLQKNKQFSDFLGVINKDMDFNVKYIMTNLIVLMIVSLPITYLIIRRNVKTMDMKGEE